MKSHIWGGAKGLSEGGMSSGQLYIETFYPSNPACLFHRPGETVNWRHCRGTVCVFMSTNVKDCLKWRTWGGGSLQNPVVKSIIKLISLMLCWEWQMVFIYIYPLNIFACWCTYPCISPLVWRGWLIQKRFLWRYCPQDRFWCFEYEILPIKKLLLRKRNA